jgi:hypothetical protein
MEAREFEMFCQNLTDSQLLAVIEKETKASTGSRYRNDCKVIALREQSRREKDDSD